MVAGVRKLQQFFTSNLRGARRVLMMLAHMVLLLEHARSLLFRGFSSEPFFYACLLPPMAGAVSLMAGHFTSSAPVEFLLQLSAPYSSGSSLFEHHLGGG
jgi:hypothetical protein